MLGHPVMAPHRPIAGHQGKQEDVKEMYERALGLIDGVLGKAHPTTLTSMSKLALVY